MILKDVLIINNNVYVRVNRHPKKRHRVQDLSDFKDIGQERI